MSWGGCQFPASKGHFQRKAVVQCGLWNHHIVSWPRMQAAFGGKEEAGSTRHLGTHSVLPWKDNQILPGSATRAPVWTRIQEEREWKQQSDWKGNKTVRAGGDLRVCTQLEGAGGGTQRGRRGNEGRVLCGPWGRFHDPTATPQCRRSSKAKRK